MMSVNKRTRSRGENSQPKKLKAGPAVGDRCPDFQVETDESQPTNKLTTSLKEMVKDSGVVLFFYPRANTSGCTVQACAFRDNMEAIEKKGYKIYGMSADKPRSQANWKKKQRLEYCLLSDPTYEVLEKLGVLKSKNKIERSLMVIEKGGIIKSIQLGITPKNSVAGAMEGIGGEAATESVSAQDAKPKKEDENDAGDAAGEDLPKDAGVHAEDGDQEDANSAENPSATEAAQEKEPAANAGTEKPADDTTDQMEVDAAAVVENGEGVEGCEENIPNAEALKAENDSHPAPDAQNGLQNKMEGVSETHKATEKTLDNETDSTTPVRVGRMSIG